MRSAFLAEILAHPAVRDARRAHAVLILDEALQAALFIDSPARGILGLSDDGTLPPLLARQLGSAARALAARGTATALVRTASGRSLTTRLIRIPSSPNAVAMLVVEAAEAAGPERLLVELGLADDPMAALLDGHGVAMGKSPAVPFDVAAVRRDVEAFVRSGEATADRGVAGGSARLFRIGDDEVLALFRPAPQERKGTGAAPKIAALVESWHEDRASADPAAAGRPRRLHSIWGAAGPRENAGDRPTQAPSEHEPATPSDQPVVEAPETRQPIDIPSVVTLPDSDPAGNDGAAETAFVARFDASPARFVWQIDPEGRFRSFSPEFAAAVGPRASAVVGRRFAEVAEEFGFDEDGAIRRLLDRRDTWSGRTVLWPVDGTDRRVPIDLAALPIYARDRSFEGFRGFGIVRSLDHEEDPAARGLALTAKSDDIGKTDPAPPNEDAMPAPAPAPADEPETPARRPMLRTFEAELPGVSFGRRQALPQAPATNQDENGRTARAGSELRRSGETAILSEAEEAAFREIGAKLGQSPRAEAETPGALRFEPRAPEPVEAAPADPDTDGPPALAPAPAVVEDKAEAPDDAADIAPIFAALPLPLLVQGGGRIVFANQALLDLVRHADLDALTAAGGLDALFAEAPAEPGSGSMLLRRADGETMKARVHLQRVPFNGRSSLMMSFEPFVSEEERPASPSAEDRELHRKVEELQAVLDIATDGVVLADPEGMVRAANGSAEALFGAGEAELRGRPLTGLFAHESQKTVRDYLETLKDGGLAGIMNDGREVIGRVAQGGFVPLFITIGRVPEERGFCVVIRDMSHWKRIEEELVNAKRAAEAASLHKSRFLANVSHELRTPLNAIIGFADVMASECFGPIGNERYIEYLGDIKRSGHHVLDLVNDLLDISKIEAGKMELSFEAVSLNEVLAEVVATMQPQANRERVIVRSNLPASVPPVVADRRTIRQIALNLLSNSVRFTPAGGQIIASTTYTAGGDVLMRVRDSGVGMTPREIEIAMKPFQQVHRPGESRGQGTGLGLPLTKAMAEANRATFAIRSTPGEGTLVEIAFPAQRVLAD